MNLPAKAKMYILILEIVAVSLLVVYVPLFRISEAQFYGVTAFVLLSMFSEYFDVTLPYVGMISVTYAIDFALIITFGVPVALVVSFLGYVGSCLLKVRRERTPFVKAVFNLSQFVVTIVASGALYETLISWYPPGNGYRMLILIVVALTYFIVNLTLVTFLFAFLKNKSVLGVWVINMRWSVPNFLALAPIGYILSYVYTDLGLLGIIIFFLPLLLARHSFKLYMDMRDMYLRTIQSLASTIDAKDHYTAGHSQRVALYTVAIAEEINLSEDFVENLRHIALLHDIGKISVSEFILNKPGRLEEDEMTVMKGHAASGYEIVKQISFLKSPESVKHHHERWDGNGYPDGLKREEIPLGARIIAVADAFDAMTTDRPYKKGMNELQALNEVTRCKGSQFDPRMVDAFIKAFPRVKDNSPLHAPAG